MGGGRSSSPNIGPSKQVKTSDDAGHRGASLSERLIVVDHT